MVLPRLTRPFILYVVLDVSCVAAGMGVPIFCILLGLPVGWRLVRTLDPPDRPVADALAGLLRGAALTAGATFVLMAGLWGAAALPRLLGSEAEIASFGGPMILYEPRASLVGWLVLMTVISPVLRALMSLPGGHLARLSRARRADAGASA